MVIRTRSSNTSIKAQVGLCILAGAATGTLVAMIMPFSNTAVHASVDVPRLAAVSGPVAGIATNATPALLKPVVTAPAEPKNKHLQILHGFASWYGGVFNGRKTANGEKFDSNQLTACHPTLPFGSLVRVINRSNKRSVVVRINDRGDLVEEGRIIDLSKAAADKLAMTGAGLAKVDVEVLSMGGESAQR